MATLMIELVSLTGTLGVENAPALSDSAVAVPIERAPCAISASPSSQRGHTIVSLFRSTTSRPSA